MVRYFTSTADIYGSEMVKYFTAVVDIHGSEMVKYIESLKLDNLRLYFVALKN